MRTVIHALVPSAARSEPSYTKSGRLLHLGVIPEMPEAFDRDRYERRRLPGDPGCGASAVAG
jgi:hypothetical protein